MAGMKKEFLTDLYAGWLGKIIGVRFGAQVEGWEYESIRKIYGELDGYVIDYNDFAADDDTNGPLFFIRALEDSPTSPQITAQDVGEALLNYVPYEHSFFWWGGYGISTEHTAYLNLRNGIPAPKSGSIALNGAAVAEQIGGQIFIETWGLVTPGNPDLAADYAQKAASVTHDRNGIYGGQFIAACVSYAFVEKNMRKIIDKGLSYLPSSSEYFRMAQAVLGFYAKHPDDWRACFAYVHSHFGYDRYPGACHIIPNAAVVILALLYGEGEFDKSLNICNMCGWDTDCNVANVGSILGVKCGIEGIDYKKWIRPLHDQLTCSSVLGTLNSVDISSSALYLYKLAYLVAGEEMPQPYRRYASHNQIWCNFDLPYATHSFRAKPAAPVATFEHHICTMQDENIGEGGFLKAVINPIQVGQSFFLYKKTYFQPADFHDGRYEPSFSPTAYPGQTVRCKVFSPAFNQYQLRVNLYAKDLNNDRIVRSEGVDLQEDRWTNLMHTIPPQDDGCISELGVEVMAINSLLRPTQVTILLDDFVVDGAPSYQINFAKERMEVWPGYHSEVSQFSHLKGLWRLDEQHRLSGSCADYGEAYTGSLSLEDYHLTAQLVPGTGEHHGLLVRVQGAIRSYYVGFHGRDKVALLKNQNGHSVLDEKPFVWEHGKAYTLTTELIGNRIRVAIDGQQIIDYTDNDRPYLAGCVGAAVMKGSHCQYVLFHIQSIQP